VHNDKDVLCRVLQSRLGCAGRGQHPPYKGEMLLIQVVEAELCAVARVGQGSRHYHESVALTDLVTKSARVGRDWCEALPRPARQAARLRDRHASVLIRPGPGVPTFDLDVVPSATGWLRPVI
jgi:hypothetical protein